MLSSPGSRIGRPVELCTSTSTRYISRTTTDLKTVHVCSQDSSKIPEYKTPLQTCTFRFDAGRVMCATYTTEKKHSKRQKYEWHFYTPHPIHCFDRVQKLRQDWVWFQNRVSRDGSNSVSTVPSLRSRQASRSLSLVQVSLLVVALHFARKTPSAQYVSSCEWIPFLLIMLTAAEESQHWICCHVEHVSSASFPDFRNQCHCCRRPTLSQAPDSAATNSASPLLGAIVDCFLLVFSECVPTKSALHPRRSSTHAEPINVSSQNCVATSQHRTFRSSSHSFQVESHRLHCHDSRVSKEISLDSLDVSHVRVAFSTNTR